MRRSKIVLETCQIINDNENGDNNFQRPDLSCGGAFLVKIIVQNIEKRQYKTEVVEIDNLTAEQEFLKKSCLHDHDQNGQKTCIKRKEI